MEFNTGIYAIENLKDRRAYVGATKRGFLIRWGSHRSALLRGRHDVPSLQVDWDRHGPGWFVFVPLEDGFDQEFFAPREQSWIDRLTSEGFSLYNRAPAAEMPLGCASDVDPARTCYTIEEAAEILQLPACQVRQDIISGKIDGFHIGNTWRVSPLSIEKFRPRSSEPFFLGEI